MRGMRMQASALNSIVLHHSLSSAPHTHPTIPKQAPT